jgi:hypothetical protein
VNVSGLIYYIHKGVPQHDAVLGESEIIVCFEDFVLLLAKQKKTQMFFSLDA